MFLFVLCIFCLMYSANKICNELNRIFSMNAQGIKEITGRMYNKYAPCKAIAGFLTLFSLVFDL